MAFPTTAFSDPTSAQSALMNKATENGLSDIVLDGNPATVNAVLANLFTELPSTTAVGPSLTTGPGVGITSGTGTICKTGITRVGGLIKTEFLIDLTGLNSGGSAGDIIGKNGTGVAYIGRLSSANGTITAIRMTCLEAPAGGDDDIDLYSATEGTGVEDTAISALTEVQLINSGTLASGTVVAAADMPAAATDYLYLVGQGTNNATYTAGKLLIELYGI